MTPEEIVAKLTTALDNFEPITGQPSDTDLTRLWEAVAPLLLQILYDKTGGKHNLIGLIRPKLAYSTRNGEAFPEPKRVGAYDIDIDDNAMAVVRARREASHKVRRADRATFETARRETTQFVLAVVANSWDRELRDPILFTPRSAQKTFLHTCKQDAPAITPSTSWRCTTICSATTLRLRASLSILFFSFFPFWSGLQSPNAY